MQSHRYFAALPLHQTDDRRISVTHWHEIDQGNTAIPGIENRLQHHGAVVISAADTWHRVGGADLPSSVFGRAEQGCEARIAVEAWPAQPIDGAVATDEGRGLAITDQRIVLDGHRKIRAYRRLLPTARPGDDTCTLELRLDLWDGRWLGAIARDDGKSILRQRGIELVHNHRDDVLHRSIHIDADRILVGIGPLQNCELAVEKGCRRI